MNANKLKKQNSKKRLDDRTISGTDGSRNQASFGHPLTRTRLGFRSGRTNERTNERDNEQIDGRTDANSTTLHQQDQHQHQQHQPRRRRRAASVESGMADEKGRARRRRRRGGDESGRNLASRRQNWRHPLRSHGDTAWERHLAGHPQGLLLLCPNNRPNRDRLKSGPVQDYVSSGDDGSQARPDDSLLISVTNAGAVGVGAAGAALAYPSTSFPCSTAPLHRPTIRLYRYWQFLWVIALVGCVDVGVVLCALKRSG